MRPQNKAYLESFITNCRQLNRSKHTLINYRADLEKFIHWYEWAYPHRPLHKVESKIITAYQRWMGEGGQANSPSFKGIWGRLKQFFSNKANIAPPPSSRPLAITTRRRHLSALKNFFEYLKQTHEERGKIFLSNPIKSKIHSLRLKEVDIFHTPMLEVKEWEMIQNNTWKIKEKLMVNLLYYGALRLSELGQLQVDNFDSHSQSITFARKGGKVQTLHPVEADLLFQLFSDWCEQRGGSQSSSWLFPGRRGKAITPRALYNTITNILRSSGVPIATPHSFRKARATLLYLETKDLLRVRDYLGHSDAKVTQTYIDSRFFPQGISEVRS